MDDDSRKTLLYKLNKDTLINLIVKENITEVYIIIQRAQVMIELFLFIELYKAW